MAIKGKFSISVNCLMLALIMLLTACSGALPERAPGITPPSGAGTGRLQLGCDRETGRITVYDSVTGVTWGAPGEEEIEADGSRGANKFILYSNIVIYTVQPGPADSIVSQSMWVSHTNSVNSGGLTVEENGNGFRLTYEFERAGIVIPLDIWIENDSLVARVESEGIRETGDNKLYWLSILPYFGAGGRGDEGYLVVPDGSGVSIGFNNLRSGYRTYSEPVYGFDLALSGISAPQVKKTVNMPVFGIERNGAAMLGVIARGSGSARIEAHTNGQVNGFNTVYPTFYFIVSDQLQIGSLSDYQSRSVEKYAHGEKITDVCEVRYLFPQTGGYSGMAQSYREYLINSGQAKEKAVKDAPPMYVGLFGGLRKTESAAGFLVDRYKAMTTFKEAETIVGELSSAGVSDMVVIYENWTGQQARGTIQTNANAAPQLGGNNGRAGFEKKLADSGIEAFFSYDPAEIGKTSLSFLPFKDSARKIGGAPILLHKYSKASGYMYIYEPAGYLPSYAKLSGVIDGFMRAAGKQNIAGLYYPSLTSELYSSYSPKNFISRESALEMAGTLLARGDAPKMGYSSNIYAVGELSHILAAPAATTMQNLADGAIPFYQLVVNGLAGYSTPCVNMHGDARYMALKAIETGAGLYFDWVYNDPSVFMETVYDYMFSSDYSRWFDDAVGAYLEVAEAFSQIGSGRFIRHEQLAGGVARSWYENGGSVVVNYTSEPYLFGGAAVPPSGWLVIG